MLEIITDSMSDIPLEIKEYYHLCVIPVLVVIDGEGHLDGETVRPSELYETQRERKQEISAYHINPDMFEEALRGYVEMRVPVLYVCLSTGVAIIWNAVHITRENLLEEYPEFDLSVVGDRCASTGFGLLVYYLLRLREKGVDWEMLLEVAEYYREHIHHVLTVDILECLIRGGRVTEGKGMVAETLSIRPVITVDKRENLKTLRLVRGTRKAYRALAKYVVEHGAKFENQPVAFYHGTVLEAVEGLMGVMKLIGAEMKRPMVSQVECVIGAHTGRRIVGICFLDVMDWYEAFEGTAEDVW